MMLRGPLAPERMRSGDGALLSVLLSDFFGALAGSMVHLTMIWWVLSQDIPDNIVGLMVLAIFVPLNLGVLLSGVAVMRFGARALLVYSKLVAILGALSCGVLLAADLMTLPILAVVAVITYGAMSPSIAADVSRVPALTRLASRKLASFHAINGMVMVMGQVGGMVLAGLLADRVTPASVVFMAIGLLVMSALVTWAYFPRDRLRPMEPMSVMKQIQDMTLRVVARLDASSLGRNVVVATIGIVAVAEALSEVILPLDFRAAEQSAVALSGAYAVSIIAGVAGAYWAQAKHDEVELAPTILAFAGILLASVVLGWLIGGTVGITLAVAAASGMAWAAGTMTVSTLQMVMPASLQAQAMALWQAVSLAAGAIAILICGQIGYLGLPFLVLVSIAALAVCFVKRPS